MTISELRHNPLSDDMVFKLLQATESHAEINTLFNIYPDLQEMTSKILLLLDAYYWVRCNNENIEINTVIQDYFTSNLNSYANRFVQSYQDCTVYAKEKRAETDVLTAVDIVKINYAILNLDNRLLLSEKDADFDYMPCIECFWLILNELYSPKRQYPLLLEAAITIFRFLSFSGEERVNLPTLSVLLSGVLGSDLAFGGLIKQWTLLTDPRGTFVTLDSENTLLHILMVFEKMWQFQSQIVYRLIEIKLDVLQRLQTSCPALASSRIAELLANTICLRVNDVKTELDISYRTAINYLKSLECSGILYSIKIGRTRHYFNHIYCDLIQNLV